MAVAEEEEVDFVVVVVVVVVGVLLMILLWRNSITNETVYGQTNQLTERLTDGRTDTPFNRDAWTHLKNDQFLLIQLFKIKK